MTTTHTQPAGCDLDSLRDLIANDGFAMSFQSMGQYRAALIAAARAAQAPTGLQDEQGLADEGLDYLLQYIPVPAARVAAQCKVAELRAAQAPQGDTRQGAHTCTGCDPAEGFCRDCREAERKAAHTCTPADERARFEVWAKTKGLSIRRSTEADHGIYIEKPTRDAWEVWQARAAQGAGTAPTYWNSQRKMIERAIIGLRDGWATRKDADDALAILAAPDQGAGTAPVGADERTIVAMPEEMPDAVESAILPLMDCSSPEGFYIAIRAALAQGAGTAPVGYMLVPVELPPTVVDAVAEASYDLDDTARTIVKEEWACTLGMLKLHNATHPAPVSTAPSKSPEFEGIGDVPVSTAAATTASASDVPCYGASRPSEMCPCRDCEAWRERVAKTMGRAADGQQGASRAVLEKVKGRFANILERNPTEPTRKDALAGIALIDVALARAPLPAQADGQGDAA